MIPVQRRRWIARAIKVGLVGVAVIVVMAWVHARRGGDRTEFRIEPHPEPTVGVEPSAEARSAATRSIEATLEPGDTFIFNKDSSINLVLRGAEVLAGLSPQMRAKITQEIAQSTTDDTTGFGAAIANVVKTTVASAIGTHAVYPLRTIRDMEYRDGRIFIVRNNGVKIELLGNIKSDGVEVSRTFAPDEAQRFIDAVRARKRELRGR
jgi:hypothetical protein